MGPIVAFSPAPAGKKSLPPLYAVISLIYVVAALSGAKNVVVVCSCPCGSLLLLHAEHKMCPRIKSTLASLATPYIVLAITRPYRRNKRLSKAVSGVSTAVSPQSLSAERRSVVFLADGHEMCLSRGMKDMIMAQDNLFSAHNCWLILTHFFVLA